MRDFRQTSRLQIGQNALRCRIGAFVGNFLQIAFFVKLERVFLVGKRHHDNRIRLRIEQNLFGNAVVVDNI